MEPQSDNYWYKQYVSYGGFCPVCGEGLEPLLNEDIETFGLCELGGNHAR